MSRPQHFLVVFDFRPLHYLCRPRVFDCYTFGGEDILSLMNMNTNCKEMCQKYRMIKITCMHAFLFLPTCMQAWQRQFLPVNVTRSPVGKGRLQRAQVKQAFLKKKSWGEQLLNKKLNKEGTNFEEWRRWRRSPGGKCFQERWPLLPPQKGCILRTWSQNLSEIQHILRSLWKGCWWWWLWWWGKWRCQWQWRWTW